MKAIWEFGATGVYSGYAYTPHARSGQSTTGGLVTTSVIGILLEVGWNLPWKPLFFSSGYWESVNNWFNLQLLIVEDRWDGPCQQEEITPMFERSFFEGRQLAIG